MGLWDEYMRDEGYKEYEMQDRNHEMTTSTRCNWCADPLIFHSVRRTRWHGFLCRLARLSKTFEYVPLVRRNRP